MSKELDKEYRPTIMLPPLALDQVERARSGLRKTIEKEGFFATLKKLTEGLFRWQDEPDQESARRKQRVNLIFSQKELEAITSMFIFKVIGDSPFLIKNMKSRRPEEAKSLGVSVNNSTSEDCDACAKCTFSIGIFSYEFDCPDPYEEKEECDPIEYDWKRCYKVEVCRKYICIFGKCHLKSTSERHSPIEGCSPKK